MRKLTASVFVLFLLTGNPASADEVLSKVLDRISVGGESAFYIQGSSSANINGRRFGADNIGGISAALNLSVEVAEQGCAKVQLKYMDNGTLEPDSELLASANEINAGPDNRNQVLVKKAYYTQEFFSGRFFLAAGKADPETWMDGNAYAGDQYVQFIGQALVDNPVFDLEDENGPALAAGVRLADEWSLAVVGVSTSHPWPGARSTKSEWEDVLSGPFVGAQVTFSPKQGDLAGNYRLYAWSASYDHANLDPAKPGFSPGWGLGISLDQEIFRNGGAFVRAGYQNEEVYACPWFVSGGLSFTGLFPGRENDIWALGAAWLSHNGSLPDRDAETHLETYYRVIFNQHISLSPDVQYILNPGQDPNAGDLWVWMLRLELAF
ncbi:MAG: carbohydrate porin [Thermodesulfobacteriota bacterium]